MRQIELNWKILKIILLDHCQLWISQFLEKTSNEIFKKNE